MTTCEWVAKQLVGKTVKTVEPTEVGVGLKITFNDGTVLDVSHFEGDGFIELNGKEVKFS
jgi:hypothetical protein